MPFVTFDNSILTGLLLDNGLTMQRHGKSTAIDKNRTPEYATHFRRLMRLWAKTWRVAGLDEHVTIDWSRRLTRTLGRAYPQRLLIRLNERLLEPQYAGLLKEVLCHEAAHLAAFLRHGHDAASHGPEWKRLVELAGYTARIGIHIPDLVLPSKAPVRYEHVCPVCQTRRFAKRRQPSWRCLACRQRGLDGQLIIVRRPSTAKVLDDR